MESGDNMNEQLLFTSSAILNLLLEIDELKDYSLNINETIDGKLQLQVGESVYEISTDDTEVLEIETTSDVLEDVESFNADTYEDIVETYTSDIVTQPDEVITSGILKEIAKTFLLGGAVRLTKSLLD